MILTKLSVYMFLFPANHSWNSQNILHFFSFFVSRYICCNFYSSKEPKSSRTYVIISLSLRYFLDCFSFRNYLSSRKKAGFCLLGVLRTLYKLRRHKGSVPGADWPDTEFRRHVEGMFSFLILQGNSCTTSLSSIKIDR